MLKIGVIGDLFVYKTTDILELIYNDKLAKNMAAIIPICIDENLDFESLQSKFDILIINNNMKKKSQESLIKSDISSEVTIINSDEKNIYKSLNSKSKRIITYGLNNKACVTASSVSENAVLFCIQRAFSTFAGETVEQQEFSIPVKNAEDNIHSVLAAVTSALIDDFSTEKICASFE